MHTNVSAKETSFENVQIQARPMKIGEEYANFCTDQWLEAKQEIDDSKECENMDEKERIDFLCNIILVIHLYHNVPGSLLKGFMYPVI